MKIQVVQNTNNIFQNTRVFDEYDTKYNFGLQKMIEH